jgi:cell division protein FtsI/penicillin-binding protein 2
MPVKPRKPSRRGEPKRSFYLVAVTHALRTVGAGVYLVVAAGIFALVYWRMGDLNLRFTDRVNNAEAASQSSEDATLFVNLVRANLIVPREADSGLDMAPPDYVLIRRAGGKKEDDDEDGVSEGEQETLLKALYDSAAGTIVRTQVNLWNGTRRMTAVRDDRPVSAEDANKVQWKAASEGGIPKPLTNLVPESFGFVNKDAIPKGMSDWVAVAGARENERVVFSTRLGSQSGPLRIQIIGKPVKTPPGARVERRTYDFFAEKGELKWACKTVAEAAVVTLPSVRGDTNIEITVEPAANCSPNVFGLAISMTGEDLAGKPRTRPKRKKRAKAIQGKDKESGTITTGTIEWVYNWRPVARATPTAARSDKLFVVRTADGQALTDPNGSGKPTQLAVDLGLISLLGYSRSDSMSVIGLLSQSKLAAGNTEVALTIDSRLQKIVQSTLTYHVTKKIDNIDRPRRMFHERRASITVLDVDTGALVAIGSWPLVPLGARPWDYISYQITNPTKDPTMIASWQLLTIDNTPGSTWKTFTSLTSALEASDSGAKPDPAIAQMLLGMDAGTFQSRLGIPMGATTVPIPGSTTRSISNIGGSGTHTSGPLRASVCAEASNASTLNVSLALKHSFNVYFARLAMLLEEAQVKAWVQSLPKSRSSWTVLKKFPPTRMMIRMKQIGIDPEEPMDLGANLTDAQPLLRIKGRFTFDKLYVRPPLTAITNNVNLPPNPPTAYIPDYMHRIALNGIGQAWSVSTMHLALSSATIAKGARVRPYLIHQWGKDRLGPPKPPAGTDDRLNIRDDLLRAIRLGMKAVTEAPGATASGVYVAEPAFVHGEEFAKVRNTEVGRRVAAIRQGSAKNGVKPFWCRTFGKTGTADPKKGGGYNSGWFTSWKEPLKPGGRRLAIACMVSHLDHAFGGPRFGGAVCGSIVRDIMISMETLERPDLQANPGEDEPPKQPDAPEGTEGDENERPPRN